MSEFSTDKVLSNFSYADDSEPISFLGDVCENGALPVIFALLFFGSIASTCTLLYLNDSKKNRAKAQRRSLTGTKFEEIFVAPFVPSNLETLVALIYFFWFLQTVTFAMARFYERKWKNDTLAQQSLFNYMSYFWNCKGLNPFAVNYTHEQSVEDAKQKQKGLFHFFRADNGNQEGTAKVDGIPFQDAEFYFGNHITWGLLWLTLGFIQIFKAQKGWSEDIHIRHRAHRLFGIVASVAFLGHLTMATSMVKRNIVNQDWVIVTQYSSMIVECILLACNGMYWAWRASTSKKMAAEEADPRRKVALLTEVKRYRAKHMVRMFFTWLQSVAGSGSVRLSAWILWVASKFFTMDVRVLMERGTCQTYAVSGYPIGCELGEPGCLVPAGNPMADSIYCWKPVFINLAIMDAIILWLEWIFLRLDSVVENREEFHDFDLADKNVMLTKFRAMYRFLGFFLFAVFGPITFPDKLLKGIIVIYAISIKTTALRMYVTHFVLEYSMTEEPGEGMLDALARKANFVLAKFYGIDIPEQHPHEKTNTVTNDQHQHQE